MTPRILAQLAALALAEANALRDDPDGRIVNKNGYTEHQPYYSDYRVLTAAERAEEDRLRVLGYRCDYAAIEAGLRCSCGECLFGDAMLCRYRKDEVELFPEIESSEEVA